MLRVHCLVASSLIAFACDEGASPEGVTAPAICREGAFPCARGLAGLSVGLGLYLEILCSNDIRALSERVGCSAEFEVAARCSEEQPPTCDSEGQLVPGGCRRAHEELAECVAHNGSACEAALVACSRCICEACPCDAACERALAEREACKQTCEGVERVDACLVDCEMIPRPAATAFDECVQEAPVTTCAGSCQ
jgi:hypothetical protein